MKINAYTAEGRARLELALAEFRKLSDPMRYDPGRASEHFVMSGLRGRVHEHSLDEVLEACEDLLDAITIIRNFDSRAFDYLNRSFEYLANKRREEVGPAETMFQPPRGLAGKAIVTDRPLSATEAEARARATAEVVAALKPAPLTDADPSSQAYAEALAKLEASIRSTVMPDTLPSMLPAPKAAK